MTTYKPGDSRITEAWVKIRVKQTLHNYTNILVDMPAANMYGKSGRHDFVICQNGWYWTIETKAKRGKPTANQIAFARQVHEAGGVSLLINEFNLEYVKLAADWFSTHAKSPYRPFSGCVVVIPTYPEAFHA